MKRWLVVLAALLLPGIAPAAEPLGRLFYNPAQRAQLDIARTQRSRVSLATEQAEAEPLPQVVTFSGAVRRSDGKSTVWLNNKPVEDGAVRGPVTVSRGRDGSVTLRTPQSERSVNLKVGQSVELVSGRIEEPYARPPTPTKPAAKDAKPASAPKSENADKAAQRKREDEEQELARLRAAAEPPAKPAPTAPAKVQ